MQHRKPVPFEAIVSSADGRAQAAHIGGREQPLGEHADVHRALGMDDMQHRGMQRLLF